MLYKIGICDDDKVYSSVLQRMIEQQTACDIEIETFTCGEELLMSPDIRRFNLVFIDIVMQGLSGIEVAEKLREQAKDVVIVLCSGVRQPTTRCFHLAVYRYIMKGDVREAGEAVKSALQKMQDVFGTWSIVVENHDGMRRIPVNRILYATRKRSGSELVLCGETDSTKESIESLKKLQDLYLELAQMPGSCFGFPHNSYFVNTKYIKELHKYYLILEDGEQMNIARDRYIEFSRIFINSKGNKYGKESHRFENL